MPFLSSTRDNNSSKEAFVFGEIFPTKFIKDYCNYFQMNKLQFIKTTNSFANNFLFKKIGKKLIFSENI